MIVQWILINDDDMDTRAAGKFTRVPPAGMTGRQGASVRVCKIS